MDHDRRKTKGPGSGIVTVGSVRQRHQTAFRSPESSVEGESSFQVYHLLSEAQDRKSQRRLELYWQLYFKPETPRQEPLWRRTQRPRTHHISSTMITDFASPLPTNTDRERLQYSPQYQIKLPQRRLSSTSQLKPPSLKRQRNLAKQPPKREPVHASSDELSDLEDSSSCSSDNSRSSSSVSFETEPLVDCWRTSRSRNPQRRCTKSNRMSTTRKDKPIVKNSTEETPMSSDESSGKTREKETEPLTGKKTKGENRTSAKKSSSNSKFTHRVPMTQLQRPLFYISGGNGGDLVEAPLLALGWKRTTDRHCDNFRLKWTESKAQIDYTSFREGEQMVNHIPNYELFTNKLGLVLSLREYERVTLAVNNRLPRLQMSDFVPETYIIDNKQERETFLQVYKEGEIWINKPTGLNQGIGIYLIRDIDQFKQEAIVREEQLNNQKGTRRPMGRVVQRYINNPLLLEGRKFDIRCYMLIASTVPFLVFYHAGYIRLSLHKYSNSSENLTVHLTNQYIQKKDPAYEKVKNESVWSMDRFNDYINYAYMKQKNLPEDWGHNYLPRQMQRIMQHIFTSVKHKLIARPGLFELYGLDFMIDENMKVWLIEVNMNPALSTNCELLVDILPPMVEESLNISIECFDKKRRRQALLPLSSQKQFVLIHDGSGTQRNFNRTSPSMSLQWEGVAPRYMNNTKSSDVIQTPSVANVTTSTQQLPLTTKRTLTKPQKPFTAGQPSDYCARVPTEDPQPQYNAGSVPVPVPKSVSNDTQVSSSRSTKSSRGLESSFRSFQKMSVTRPQINRLTPLSANSALPRTPSNIRWARNTQHTSQVHSNKETSLLQPTTQSYSAFEDEKKVSRDSENSPSSPALISDNNFESPVQTERNIDPIEEQTSSSTCDKVVIAEKEKNATNQSPEIVQDAASLSDENKTDSPIIVEENTDTLSDRNSSPTPVTPNASSVPDDPVQKARQQLLEECVRDNMSMVRNIKRPGSHSVFAGRLAPLDKAAGSRSLIRSPSPRFIPAPMTTIRVVSTTDKNVRVHLPESDPSVAGALAEKTRTAKKRNRSPIYRSS